MKFNVTKSSSEGYGKDSNEPMLDVNSLEELCNFVAISGKPGILLPPSDCTPEWTLEIYDDFRE